MKKNKFDVKVEEDKFNNQPILSITHNGYQWTSIRLENPLYEIPKIILALYKYLREMP